MSRLRQINSQNYHSSGSINDEFESIVRYLNSAEFGNKTVSELMDILFDEDGEFDASIELRLDTSSGLQYRSGSYTSSEEGWQTVVNIDDIRGNTGIDYGTIGEPVFESRFEFTATGGETELDVPHDNTALFMVYKNGILQTEGAGDDYTTNESGGTGSAGSITFNVALVADDKITIFKITSGAGFDFVRTEYVTSGSQSNFGFVHEENEAIQVYKNGILQKEGVTDDYYRDSQNDLIIFVTPVPDANRVTIVSIKSLEARTVIGLMTEAAYTDLNGYIKYSKIAVADDEIDQVKVNGLVAALAASPDFEAGSSTPNPATRFWLDTSSNPNQLKFYDGTKYLSANPATSMPSFDENNASQALFVDATGTILEFADLDFSSLIPKTQKAAANGVASLDSSARLPSTQLPEVITFNSIDYYGAGAVSDGSKRIRRIFKQEVVIHAIDLRTDGGTCDVQVEIDGLAVGDTHNVSVTPTTVTLATPITVDALTSSKLIGLLVSNAAAATNLDVTLALKIKSQ